ncbi:MAG: hypothetical protein JSR20_15440 [Nitrospira sp.]|nr:hypothetical protein [Nitrospira sp.]
MNRVTSSELPVCRSPGRTLHLQLTLVLFALSGLFALEAWGPSLTTSQALPLHTVVQSSRTSSVYIGSVMAMLATFEDAGILPPEGTPQANRIIKAVIQFQSAFLKSEHPAIRQFFTDAHRATLGDHAEEVEAAFRLAGWSADTFEAVIAAGQQNNAWIADGISEGFREFNIGKQDFDLLAELYRQSNSAFSTKGTTFQQVYAQRRREMPGAKVD